MLRRTASNIEHKKDKLIVKNIYNGPINSGYHSYTWNANNVSSGIYFVVLKTEDFNASQKITLIK